MVVLLGLSYWIISSELETQRYSYRYQRQDSVDKTTPEAGRSAFWIRFFAYYCLLIHVLVAIFPVRSCWAIWDITRSLRKTAHSNTLEDVKFPNGRRESCASLSSAETLTCSRDTSTSSSEIGDESEYLIDSDIETERIVHAIIVPNYKEEMDTLRETLEVLASHPQARNSYDVNAFNPLISHVSSHVTDVRLQVYLGMEQREKGAELKAMSLISEFTKNFRSIDFTLHPADIPGEAAGKGSNVNWVARKLSQRYPLKARKDVIITGIDGMSHVLSW